MKKNQAKTIVNDLQEKISWKLLDLYYNRPNAAVSHQIDSFNEFVTNYIPSIIRKNMPFVTGVGNRNYGPGNTHYQKEYILDIVDFKCVKPTQIVDGNITNLYPNECRSRHCSYSAKTYITILQKTVDYSDPTIINGVTTEEEPKTIFFFKLPIMLRSKFCHLDGLSPDQLNELGEDRYEPGGYFIINGGEKVIISQERITDNQFLVWPPSKSDKALATGEIKSTINQLFYPVKSNYIKLFKEPKVEDYIKKNFKEALSIKGAQIYYNISVTGLSDYDIPIAIVFKALGIVSDKDIVRFITETEETSIYTKWIQPSLRFAHAININTQEQAIRYIACLKSGFKEPSENDYAFVQSIIDKDILPHLLKDQLRKCYYIGFMVKRTIDCHLGILEFNDRDHYSNKRVDLAGHLLLKIFRGKFIGLINKLTSASVKALNNEGEYTNAAKDISGADLTSVFESSLATGKFKTNYYDTSTNDGEAVCQQYSYLSYIARVAHTRRLQSPSSKAISTVTKPKQLHESQCAFTCLNESPEGHDVGMVKNFALTCTVSLYTPDYSIVALIKKISTFDSYNVQMINDIPIDSSVNLANKVRIYNNADLLAFCDSQDIERVYDDLVICKRHCVISPYCSIELNPYERSLIIHSDGGRFIRPVLIVENNEVLLYKRIREDPAFAKKFFNDEITFDDLLMSSVKLSDKDLCTKTNGAYIEFIDPLQSEFCMIGLREKDIIEAKNQQDSRKEQQMYKKYTHCEIHPIVMQGLVSSIIPFSDHTPNPRNNYQCSMGKQAIGVFATNFNKRFDTTANALMYGQDPIVATNTMKYLKLDKLPHGNEAMLAIACYTGYNQEDSIVVNKSSVERGFFNTLNYRTYMDIENKHISINENELFGKPSVLNKPSEIYHAINDSGEPNVNTRVKKGDVLIGKILNIKERSKIIQTDKSKVYDQDHGIIDLVLSPKTYKDFPFIAKCTKEVARDNTDNPIIKVRVSNYRKPVIGDKFASRYAQKGTISGLLKESDMPFTEHGEVPDIIMNPHGMPSRQTLGKPIELFLGTIGLLKGKYMNATPFDFVDLDSYEKELEKLDFTRANSEAEMYNGMTGNKFNVRIFYGPMYYQRLKHMVEDKVFSRANGGRIQSLTRQPAEGRSREGGLRVGEMERDCLIAYNATKVLKGKFFDESDKFKVYVSKDTGCIIVGNPSENKFMYNGKDIRLSGDSYFEVQLPYAMKLLMQELNCMGMDIRLKKF